MQKFLLRCFRHHHRRPSHLCRQCPQFRCLDSHLHRHLRELLMIP
jgi:hypothetical protein